MHDREAGIGSVMRGAVSALPVSPQYARVRDKDFRSTDEQRQETKGCDPVRDTDDRRVPQSDRRWQDQTTDGFPKQNWTF